MRKKLLPIFIYGISILWVSAIIFFYLFSIQKINDCDTNNCFKFFNSHYLVLKNSAHSYYFDAIKSLISKDPTKGKATVVNPLLILFFAFVLLYSISIVFLKFIKKKKRLVFTLKPLHLMVYFLSVFICLYISWIYYFQFGSYTIGYTGIIAHALILFFEITFVTILTAGLGKKVFDLIFEHEKEEKDIALKLFFSIGLGIILISNILFVFGAFNVLKPITVWTFYTLILLFSIPEIKGLYNSFSKVRLHVDVPFFSPLTLVFFLLILLFAQNSLDLIRPLPVGYDDMARYMNRVNLLFSEGKLINGYLNYPWEMYLSSGLLLFQSQDSTIFVNLMRNLLTLSSLLYFIKYYCDSRKINRENPYFYPSLLVLIFYSLPLVIFQTSKDLKVDIAGLFFVIIGSISFWKWKDTLNHKENKRGLFYLSALFLGFASCIKYTFSLYLIVLALYVVFLFYQHKIKPKIYTKMLFSGILFALCAFIPFSIQNVYTSGNIKTVFISQSDNLAYKKIQDLYNNLPADKKNEVADTGTREEVGRYTGYSKNYVKFFSLPFASVFQYNVDGPYLDSGILFLTLIPIFFILWLTYRKKIDPQRKIFPIMILTILYWFLWLFLGQGIIWYGLAGFVFLVLLIAEYFNFLENKQFAFLKIFTSIVIILGISASLILRFAYIPKSSNISPDAASLTYASGIINRDIYYNSSYRDYISSLNQINSDISKNETDPPKILKINSPLGYFIKENDKSVIEDNQLDLFNKLNYDRDSKKTLERFKSLNIKYLIVNTATPTMDKTPEQSLVKKYQAFANFIGENYEVINTIAKDGANHALILEINYKS